MSERDERKVDKFISAFMLFLCCISIILFLFIFFIIVGIIVG